MYLDRTSPQVTPEGGKIAWSIESTGDVVLLWSHYTILTYFRGYSHMCLWWQRNFWKEYIKSMTADAFGEIQNRMCFSLVVRNDVTSSWPFKSFRGSNIHVLLTLELMRKMQHGRTSSLFLAVRGTSWAVCSPSISPRVSEPWKGPSAALTQDVTSESLSSRPWFRL